MVQQNPDFIIFKAQNSKFHDFLVFEPATKTQNQHYSSSETPGHLAQSKKDMGLFLEHVIFVDLGIITNKMKLYVSFFAVNFGYLSVYQVLWRWAPENDANWLNKISRVMDMNSISIKKHEMDIW